MISVPGEDKHFETLKDTTGKGSHLVDGCDQTAPAHTLMTQNVGETRDSCGAMTVSLHLFLSQELKSHCVPTERALVKDFCLCSCSARLMSNSLCEHLLAWPCAWHLLDGF